MTTPDEFVAMRSATAEAIELAIDVAIQEAGREGKLDVEVTVKPEWRGLEQVLRAYRHAGWKVSHYMQGLEVVVRFEVAQ
jgi:hypothetical protein